MKIRSAAAKDIPALVQLYKKAAKIPEGIARSENEISENFVRDFINISLQKGLIFIIEDQDKILAEIHCYRNEPACFQHCLSNLTLVVDPQFHGQGLGRKIFTHLLEEVKNNHQNIARIELFVRQNNPRNIKFYQSLGFEIEGICKNRLLDAKGNLSDDTMMAWLNPKTSLPVK